MIGANQMAELGGQAALGPEVSGGSASGQRERGPWLAVLAWAATVIAASVLAAFFLSGHVVRIIGPVRPFPCNLTEPFTAYLYGTLAGLAVFLIGEYLALGFRRRGDRVIASVLLLPVVYIAALAAYLIPTPLPGSC